MLVQVNERAFVVTLTADNARAPVQSLVKFDEEVALGYRAGSITAELLPLSQRSQEISGEEGFLFLLGDIEGGVKGYFDIYFQYKGIGSFLEVYDIASNKVCPSGTLVRGTTVTFVGEVEDMGGAPYVYIWFEYGTTTNYSNKTKKRLCFILDGFV